MEFYARPLQTNHHATRGFSGQTKGGRIRTGSSAVPPFLEAGPPRLPADN